LAASVSPASGAIQELFISTSSIIDPVSASLCIGGALRDGLSSVFSTFSLLSAFF
jgi:hypothetical protein